MPWVYIMASTPRGTLYIGVTDDLRRRAREHRGSRGSAFTRKYAVKFLVWYARFEHAKDALQRERTMKDWPRAWKINLVERENPDWKDLWDSLSNQPIKNESLLDPGNKSRGIASRWIDDN